MVKQGRAQAFSAVSEGVIKALGRLTVDFNMLEQVLAFRIWQLLGVNDQAVGRIATADLQYSLLVAKFYALCLQRNGQPESTELEELRSRLIAVGDERNRMIHSVWGGGQDSDSSIALKFTARGKKGLRTSFENFRPKDIEDVAEEIRTLTGFLLRNIALGDPKPEPIRKDR